MGTRLYYPPKQQDWATLAVAEANTDGLPPPNGSYSSRRRLDSFYSSPVSVAIRSRTGWELVDRLVLVFPGLFPRMAN